MKIRDREIVLIDELPSTRFVIDNMATWETDTFDTIDRYVHGGTFVDIGAWCGIFSLYAASVAREVYAYEPDPVAFDLLTRNIAANKITNITAVNAAVWQSNDGVTLYTHPEGLGSAMTGPARTDGEPLRVDTITPAWVRTLAGTHVDLVKIDTEGSETHIVPGLIDWPVPIHLSLHRAEMDGQLDFRDRNVEWLVEHPDYPVVLLT